MTSKSYRAGLAFGVCLFAVLSGCSTSAKYKRTEGLSCVELNVAVAQSAATISRAGIIRGRIANFPLPRLLSRGEGAKQALADRQTRRIDETRAAQDRIIAERRGRCLETAADG